MGFFRQKYQSWLPCPPPGNLPNPRIKLKSTALRVDFLPAEPPGKPKNTGVGSLSLLQWIFLIRESNWGLLHCRQILYQLSYQGTKRYIQKLIHFSIKIKVFLKIKIFLREASSLKSEHWLSILIQSPRLSKRKDIWGTSNIQRFQN